MRITSCLIARENFAADKYANAFVFEPTTQVGLGPYRRRARGFLALHGDGVTGADEMAWVVAGPRDEFFGTTVLREVIDESDSMVEDGHKGQRRQRCAHP